MVLLSSAGCKGGSFVSQNIWYLRCLPLLFHDLQKIQEEVLIHDFSGNLYFGEISYLGWIERDEIQPSFLYTGRNNKKGQIMPQLSLTDFVDIVSASGTPKATKVRKIKRRPAYSPATDFYRLIRESIVETHQGGHSKAYIDRKLTALTDPKKITAYPPILEGYRKWWGNKSLNWFDPPRELYSRHGVDVSVNPELGLEVNGIPHLVKLYFKAEPLAKNRVDIITHLLAVTTSMLCPSPSTTVMSVLDVRRSKLISPTVPIVGLTGILDAELAYVAALWPTV